MKKSLLIFLFLSNLVLISNALFSKEVSDSNTIYGYAVYSESVYDINYEWKGKLLKKSI